MLNEFSQVSRETYRQACREADERTLDKIPDSLGGEYVYYGGTRATRGKLLLLRCTGVQEDKAQEQESIPDGDG